MTDEQKILDTLNRVLSDTFKWYKILSKEDGETLHTPKVNTPINIGHKGYNSWDLTDLQFEYIDVNAPVRSLKYADTIKIKNFNQSKEGDKDAKFVKKLQPIKYILQPISKFVFNYKYYGEMMIGDSSYKIHDVLAIQVDKKDKRGKFGYIDSGYRQFVSKDTVDTFDDLFKNL